MEKDKRKINPFGRVKSFGVFNPVKKEGFKFALETQETNGMEMGLFTMINWLLL